MNYYELGTETPEQLAVFRKLYFEKLPIPINIMVQEAYYTEPKTGTLGEQISFLQTWYKNYCIEVNNQKGIGNIKTNIKLK